MIEADIKTLTNNANYVNIELEVKGETDKISWSCCDAVPPFTSNSSREDSGN